MKFAIVVSRYNQNITQRLLTGSLSTFKKHRIPEKQIEIVWVPGAFEIPLLAMRLAKSKKFDGIVCLGCVLRGQTSHHEYISHAVAQGIIQASLLTGVPITLGVLTPDNLKQAMARSGNNSANKGTEAAETAIEMAEIFRRGNR